MKSILTSTTIIMNTIAILFAAAGITIEAFSSIAMPPPNNPTRRQASSPITTPTTTTTTSPTTTSSETSSSWRIVLDIGREPLAAMPFNWARSGCRMPLKIPCQFSMMSEASSSSSLLLRALEPISDTVSFTGPNGAVVRPVQGGSWTLSSAELLGKPKELIFDLTFPEQLTRRDVTIDAGTTLQCIASVYLQSDLDYLNQEFYKARDETWKIGGELNNMAARQGAPKKWNFDTNQWEKRYVAENPLQWIQKQTKYMAAKANQDIKNRQRPDPNTLSAMGGRLPGVDEYVYIQKSSCIVKAASSANGGGGGAVMGTWQAEPIIK